MDAPFFPTYDMEPLCYYHLVSQYPHCDLGSQSLATHQVCAQGLHSQMLFHDCTPVMIPHSYCVVLWTSGGFIWTSSSVWIKPSRLTSTSFLGLTSGCLYSYWNIARCSTDFFSWPSKGTYCTSRLPWRVIIGPVSYCLFSPLMSLCDAMFAYSIYPGTVLIWKLCHSPIVISSTGLLSNISSFNKAPIRALIW